MVDRDNGDIPRLYQLLYEGNTGPQTRLKTGADRDGNNVRFCIAGLLLHLLEKDGQIFYVLAFREIGKHAAVLRVERGLRREGVAEYVEFELRSEIALRLNEADCSFVARGLDA